MLKLRLWVTESCARGKKNRLNGRVGIHNITRKEEIGAGALLGDVEAGPSVASLDSECHDWIALSSSCGCEGISSGGRLLGNYARVALKGLGGMLT